MSTPPDSTTTTTQPALPSERIDLGCMLGLAMIIILLPVSLYVAAPVAVLGIAAAICAWGLMRLTPRALRAKLGVYPTFWLWFTVMVLLEIGVAGYLHYQDSFGDPTGMVRRW